MVDTMKLKGIIVENGLTQEKVAEQIGLSKKTFYLRMKEAKFNSDEMEKMTDILHIDDPMSVFFAKKVT